VHDPSHYQLRHETQSSQSQTLVDDALELECEPLRIGHDAVVETERLFVKISGAYFFEGEPD
jgi:hypothetical protein